jgi:hypothetical protein
VGPPCCGPVCSVSARPFILASTADKATRHGPLAAMGATHRVYRHRDKGTGLTPANGQSVRTVLSETTAPLVGSSCVFYRTSSLQRGGGALVPSASRVAPGPSAAFLHNWRKVTFRIQRLCVIRTILSTKNNRFTLKSTHSMASSTSVISGLRLHVRNSTDPRSSQIGTNEDSTATANICHKCLCPTVLHVGSCAGHCLVEA